MAYIIIPSRRIRQPDRFVRLSQRWASAGAIFAVGGPSGVSNTQLFAMPTAYTGTIGATPDGIGWSFAAGTQYAQFTTDISLAATSECTVEYIVYGTAFPSLSHLVSLSDVAASAGKLSVGAGKARGALAYQGTAPCNLYWWAGNNDYNSAVAHQVGVKQHVIMTKAAGTAACQITVYRNGQQLAQGNSGNAAAFAASGPYFNLGTAHASGTTAITGTIPLAVLYNRALSAAEVTDRFYYPWSIAGDDARRVYFLAPQVGGPTTYTYVGSGGITFGGAATLAKIKSYLPTGGLTFAGTAPVDKIKAYVGSGGLTFAGAATTAYVPAGSVTYSYVGSGGITFAGTAAVAKIKSFLPSGGFTFAGAATTAYTPGLVVYSYVGSGGLTFGGAAVTTGPVASSGMRPAGAPGRGKRRVVVEVDGKLVQVSGTREAQALIKSLRAKAKEEAPKLAKKALNKAREVEREDGELPEIEVEPPKVVVHEASDWLAGEFDRLNEQMQREYELAAMDAQLSLLAKRKAFDDDEEDALLALML